MPIVKFLPSEKRIKVSDGMTVLQAAQLAGIHQEAPCGGHGKCGKCKVLINGKEALACKTCIWEDMTVRIQDVSRKAQILSEGTALESHIHPVKNGKCHIGVDIGTTTVVVYLLDGQNGMILGTESILNPQFPYGADVISRIQEANNGKLKVLSEIIREEVWLLTEKLCAEHELSTETLGTMVVVANPAMQQIFFGRSPENLAKPPFTPVFTNTQIFSLSEFFPVKGNGKLLVVPDIAGYVGSDTMGCILSLGMYQSSEITLMIDIGTNGEMVLGNAEKMVACSTAAGPALEGGRISCGMRGCQGAIDHVWIEEGKLCFSVLGNVEPEGICGSGLIDVIAVMLKLGIINQRGRIQKNYRGEGKERIFDLTPQVAISQSDVREVQMAKGAIAAGIHLLMREMRVNLEDIQRVILCGAFGTYMNPESACEIGLLPGELFEKIKAGGNGAGMGSRLMALDQEKFFLTDKILRNITPIELASFPQFQRVYAENMMFPTKHQAIGETK